MDAMGNHLFDFHSIRARSAAAANDPWAFRPGARPEKSSAGREFSRSPNIPGIRARVKPNSRTSAVDEESSVLYFSFRGGLFDLALSGSRGRLPERSGKVIESLGRFTKPNRKPKTNAA